MIIVIEGIDGAGKSTLSRSLAEYAAQEGLEVKSSAFPRYSAHPTGPLFSKGLRGEVGDLLDSIYGMAVLFGLDRYAVRQELLDASADPNTILLLDRYVASNAAYSMGRVAVREEHTGLVPTSEMLSVRDFIGDFEFGQCALPEPSLSILLDTPVEISRARAKGREEALGAEPDRYEANSNLQEQTAASYRHLAQNNWHGQWVRVTHADEPRAISRRIMEELKA
ncbi:MAG: dTMP kinase [Corynebacterium sp.]|nr:dTMP kinase [Corynebacterium sp.]